MQIFITNSLSALSPSVNKRDFTFSGVPCTFYLQSKITTHNLSCLGKWPLFSFQFCRSRLIPANPVKSVFKTYPELDNFWYFYDTGPSDLSSGWLPGLSAAVCVPCQLLSTLYLQWAFCPLPDPVTRLLRVPPCILTSLSVQRSSAVFVRTDTSFKLLWGLTSPPVSLFEHTRLFLSQTLGVTVL